MNNSFVFISFLVFLNSMMHAQGDSDTVRLKTHLDRITETNAFRNYRNTEALNKIAEYIHENFEQHVDSTFYQEYKVHGKIYKNVVGIIGTDLNAKTIVIGAHYDVCGDQQGADDNASGVAALLELARLLKDRELNHSIQLVAFTLEEPPFFGTEQMGSYVHAKSLKANQIAVYGMISLEMIGCFSNDGNSQLYPIPSLSDTYGTKGDFITLVGKMDGEGFTERFNTEFKKTAAIKNMVFNNTPGLLDIALSDHINYWKFGFSALMITDTAFLRNTNYHTQGDTIEKLDIPKMAQVVDAIVATLQNMH